MAGKLNPIETNRRNVTRKPLSPHFPRSRSVTSAPTTPEIRPHLPDYAKTSGHRSLSTSKLRQKPNSENRIPHINLPSPNVAGKKPVANKLGPFSSGPTTIEKARSVSRASAWALSPGRSPESWNSRGSKSCSGGRNVNSGESKGKPGRIAGVLSLFLPKKGGLVRDGDMHTLTCMHTRLLQWRYVNARAEASMKKRKHIAEKQIFNVWIRILNMRKSVTEKKMEMQMLLNEIKLINVLKYQIRQLKAWEKMERRYFEAIAKTTRLFQALTTRVYLIEGAKVAANSLAQTMRISLGVMEGIQDTIARFFKQAEKMSCMMLELVQTIRQEEAAMEELMQLVATLASLEVEERSLRVHHIQASKERENAAQRRNYDLFWLQLPENLSFWRKVTFS